MAVENTTCQLEKLLWSMTFKMCLSTHRGVWPPPQHDHPTLILFSTFQIDDGKLFLLVFKERYVMVWHTWNICINWTHLQYARNFFSWIQVNLMRQVSLISLGSFYCFLFLCIHIIRDPRGSNVCFIVSCKYHRQDFNCRWTAFAWDKTVVKFQSVTK